MLAALPMNRHAARSAYYAMFHAAEALIVQRSGRSAKTHRGVHSEFSRLTKEGDPNDRVIWRALPDGYHHKELYDYSTDLNANISDNATSAILEDAARFVTRVEELLNDRPAAG